MLRAAKSRAAELSVLLSFGLLCCAPLCVAHCLAVVVLAVLRTVVQALAVAGPALVAAELAMW